MVGPEVPGRIDQLRDPVRYDEAVTRIASEFMETGPGPDWINGDDVEEFANGIMKIKVLRFPEVGKVLALVHAFQPMDSEETVIAYKNGLFEIAGGNSLTIGTHYTIPKGQPTSLVPLAKTKPHVEPLMQYVLESGGGSMSYIPDKDPTRLFEASYFGQVFTGPFRIVTEPPKFTEELCYVTFKR